MSDDELREVLSNLIPLVRTDYILPIGHAVSSKIWPFFFYEKSEFLPNAVVVYQVLLNAQSRGLINNSPQLESDLTASTGHHHARHQSPDHLYVGANIRNTSQASSSRADQMTDSQWTHTHHHESFTRPRLFLPYYETARTLMEKQLSENPEQLSSLINHHPPVTIPNRIPDALYMVNNLTGDGFLGQSSSQSDLTPSEITGTKGKKRNSPLYERIYNFCLDISSRCRNVGRDETTC